MRDWMKTLRDERHLTMKDVSQKLGISESYYCAIENGSRQKKMDMVLISGLASIFEVPLSAIFEYEREAAE